MGRRAVEQAIARGAVASERNADKRRIKELEARVAELEALVKQHRSSGG